MFVLRQDQYELFHQAAESSSSEGLVERLQWQYPQHHAFLGDERMREAVERARAVARDRGFTRATTIGRYAEIAMLLGASFADDPQLPMLRAILDEAGSEDERIERLAEAAHAHIVATCGANGEIIGRTLRFLQTETFGPLPPFSDADFRKYVRLYLQRIWPEKYSAIGDETVDAFIDAGIVRARAVGFSTARGVHLYLTLAYVLGWGYMHDPQLVWSASATTAAPEAESSRIDALITEGRQQLERWMRSRPTTTV